MGDQPKNINKSRKTQILFAFFLTFVIISSVCFVLFATPQNNPSKKNIHVPQALLPNQHDLKLGKALGKSSGGDGGSRESNSGEEEEDYGDPYPTEELVCDMCQGNPYTDGEFQLCHACPFNPEDTKIISCPRDFSKILILSGKYNGQKDPMIEGVIFHECRDQMNYGTNGVSSDNDCRFILNDLLDEEMDAQRRGNRDRDRRDRGRDRRDLPPRDDYRTDMRDRGRDRPPVDDRRQPRSGRNDRPSNIDDRRFLPPQPRSKNNYPPQGNNQVYLRSLASQALKNWG